MLFVCHQRLILHVFSEMCLHTNVKEDHVNKVVGGGGGVTSVVN